MACERGKLTDCRSRHWVEMEVPFAKAEGGGLSFSLLVASGAGQAHPHSPDHEPATIEAHPTVMPVKSL